jgi:hypothetical protein
MCKAPSAGSLSRSQQYTPARGQLLSRAIQLTHETRVKCPPGTKRNARRS